jgi:PAS domain S-box-containing protein
LRYDAARRRLQTQAWPFRYLIACGAFLAALALRFLFRPILGQMLPYITFFPAVALSAWVGGLGPGLLTTALSAMAALYFFVEPAGVFRPAGLGEAVGLILFLAVAGMISALIEALRRSQRVAEDRLEQLSRERHLSAITLASIGDGVITTDAQGRITLLNGAAEALTEWTAREAHGRQLEEVFSICNEQTRAAVESPVAKVLRDGQVTGLANHTLLISKSGREIPIDDSAGPILGPNGSVSGVVLVFRGISERRRAEQEAERSRRELRQILESIRDAFVFVDAGWLVRYINPEAARIMGKPDSELLGRDLWEGFGNAAGADIERFCRQAAAERTPVHFETFSELLGAWFEVHVYPSLDGGLAVSFRDVSERRRAQQQLLESEERFRFALEAAEVGTWDWNTASNEVLWSPNMESIHGLAPGTFGNSFETFLEDVHPDHRAVVIETIRKALDGDGAYRMEYRQARADGSEGWMEARGRAIRQYGAVRMAGICMNVTERKRAAEATARLAAIVDSSHDAIVGKDLDGVIRTWNAGAARLYGYAANEVIGRSMTILIPPDRVPEEASILETVHAGGLVDHFETVRLRRDGTLIDVSLTVSPIRDAGGNVIGASHIARDITERKQFNEHLKETAKLESLGVLAGGIAHDFNNLLTGMLGNASLALDALPEVHPARPLIDGVVDASERAATLVRQILAYSGKGRFIIQLVDLSELIAELANLIRSSIPKTIDLQLDLAPKLPPVETDVAQMQQLVMNLLINAAESYEPNDPGTVTVRTKVEKRETGRYVSLEVEDSGCGMDETTQARMFDPFFTTKFAGRGLGLAAVHGIVRGHKGTLNVTTAPGQGTTFRVHFPAADGTLIQTVVEEAQRDLAGRGIVLVVDDEEIVRVTARQSLERYGYTVLVAENGRRAVELFEQSHNQIAAVLLDMTMPVMSGEETLRRLKEIHPSVPVILSSGFNEVEAIRRFHGQGLAGFLQKPYTAATLAEKIKAASTSV